MVGFDILVELIVTTVIDVGNPKSKTGWDTLTTIIKRTKVAFEIQYSRNANSKLAVFAVARSTDARSCFSKVLAEGYSDSGLVVCRGV